MAKQPGPRTRHEWAAVWAGLGFPTIPINGKNPNINGADWQTLAGITDPALCTPEAFPATRNVGIITGGRAGKKADLDNDTTLGRRCWELVPPSSIAFGRGDEVTHRIYQLPAGETRAWGNVVWSLYVVKGKVTKTLELRYDGCQTMAPGSTHPDNGLEIVLVGSFPPRVPEPVDLDELLHAARFLAIAVDLAHHWPGRGSHARHDFALAVSGGLVQRGIPADDVQRVVYAAAAAAGDEQARQRGDAARAEHRTADGRPVRGFTTVQDQFQLPGFGQHLLGHLKKGPSPWKAPAPQEVGGGTSPANLDAPDPDAPPPRRRQPAQPQPAAEPARTEDSRLIEPPYSPFPTDALPAPLARVVEAVAYATNADPAAVALPALAVVGMAAGTTHCISPNGSWRNFPALWCALVGESGTNKSSPFNAALAPLTEMQRRLSAAYQEALERHRAEMAAWKATPREDRDDPPRMEVQDVVLWTNDATIEALGYVLNINRRGTLYGVEELDGLLQRLNQYSGQSSTTSQYLQMHDGWHPLNTLRISDNRRIYAPQPLLGVCGTIQPGILLEQLRGRNIDNGFLARFLLAWPAPRRNLYVREPREAAQRAKWAALVEKLHALTPQGEAEPWVIRLAPDAEDWWEQWHNRHDLRVFNLPAGLVKSADAKLPNQCLRLALIDHLITCVDAGLDTRTAVTMESMVRATRQADWFSAEHARVYLTLQEEAGLGLTRNARLEVRVVRWFRNRPEAVYATIQELRTQLKDRTGTVNDESVRAACVYLHSIGMGRVIPAPAGEKENRARFEINRAAMDADRDACEDE